VYKLTFDDKPEANTYVKWARGKGYLVEGPYRERLSKNVKKFDLNGKRKKYGFVVLRKRGAGKEGGVAKESWENRLDDTYKWFKENRRRMGGSWAQNEASCLCTYEELAIRYSLSKARNATERLGYATRIYG